MFEEIIYYQIITSSIFEGNFFFYFFYESQRKTDIDLYTLLRIRIICFICPWETRLLIQPKTTSALGCKDGLYWNANLWRNRVHYIKQRYKQNCQLFIIQSKCTTWAVRGYVLRSTTYFWASSVHWSSHLHVGISLIQA